MSCCVLLLRSHFFALAGPDNANRTTTELAILVVRGRAEGKRQDPPRLRSGDNFRLLWIELEGGGFSNHRRLAILVVLAALVDDLVDCQYRNVPQNSPADLVLTLPFGVENVHPIVWQDKSAG